MKKSINSRRKGNTAERAICKLLSEYFPGKFERRSMGIPGSDIICSDETFPYAVEVKHRKSVKALHLLIGNHQLDAWWEQACEQAIVVDKKPILVAKVERHWFSTECGVKWDLFETWCAETRNKAHK